MLQVPTNLSGITTRDPKPPRMLMIEPDKGEAQAILRAIEQYYEPGCVTHAPSLEQALSDGLDSYSLTLCSIREASEDAAIALDEILLVRPDMPIIMLAGHNNQAEAAEAVCAVAYDYVVKTEGYLQALPVVIEKNLALHQVKQENTRLQVQLTSTLGHLRTRNEQLHGLVQELKAIAATDALTGIANRRDVTQRLDQAFAHASRHDTNLAVIAIDLDGFKKLNDSSGHAAGDRVLMLVARVLKANARSSDTPGRIGGDEFVVLLPDTGSDEAQQVAERIRLDFDAAFTDLGERVGYAGRVTLSAGIATRQQTRTAESLDLLATADRALYRAKDIGGSCVVLHGEGI